MSRRAIVLLSLAGAAASCTSEVDPTAQRQTLIASVVADPTSACVGDDVLVTVTPAVSDDRLVFIVGDAVGSPQVIRAAAPGTQIISVSARLGTAHDFGSVQVAVRSCSSAPPLALRYDFAQNGDDAVLIQVLGEAPLGASYRWNFGDGTSLVTATPSTRKSYTLGGRHGAAAAYLVTVSVEAPGSASRSGKISIPAATAIDGTLPVEHERAPRVVEGAFASLLRIRNVRASAVQLTTARIRSVGCDGTVGPEAQVAAGEIFASSTLTLAVDQIWSGDLRLAPHLLRSDSCHALITLAGNDAAGSPVSADLVLEIGIPRSAQVVQDPALIAKIERARLILGHQRISLDELAELERNGRL